MCSFAYSLARLRVTASTPPLVIIGTEAVMPAIGLTTIEVVMLTTLPPDSCASICDPGSRRARRSERVPHVRRSVRGTKTVGRSPFERSCRMRTQLFPGGQLRPGVKAFENIVFGPCTLGRTWGTPPRHRLRLLDIKFLIYTQT
jgi:hypothetical protein